MRRAAGRRRATGPPSAARMPAPPSTVALPPSVTMISRRAGVDGGEQELAEADEEAHAAGRARRRRAARARSPGPTRRPRARPGRSRNRASTRRPSGSATSAVRHSPLERGRERLRRPLAAVGERQLLGARRRYAPTALARERGRSLGSPASTPLRLSGQQTTFTRRARTRAWPRRRREPERCGAPRSALGLGCLELLLDAHA